MHCILSFFLSACLLMSSLLPTSEVTPEQPPAEEITVSAPSVVLMEASTGQVIYEKEAHTSLHPASITVARISTYPLSARACMTAIAPTSS